MYYGSGGAFRVQSSYDTAVADNQPVLAVGMDHAEKALFVSTGLAPLVIRQFKTLGSASGVPSVSHTSELTKVNI